MGFGYWECQNLFPTSARMFESAEDGCDQSGDDRIKDASVKHDDKRPGHEPSIRTGIMKFFYHDLRINQNTVENRKQSQQHDRPPDFRPSDFDPLRLQRLNHLIPSDRSKIFPIKVNQPDEKP